MIPLKNQLPKQPSFFALALPLDTAAMSQGKVVVITDFLNLPQRYTSARHHFRIRKNERDMPGNLPKQLCLWDY